MTTTFTGSVEREVKEGYGAWFLPVFEGEEAPDEGIADVDAGIVRIAPDTVRTFGEVLCVETEHGFGIPLNLFEEREDDLSTDDTHDLRNRWFATEEEALGHVEYTLERWRNPLPWESFVRL